MPSHPRNILFILSDQHKWDLVGHAGRASVQTPHLDALARRGTHFRQAICPSPLCVTSRAATLTGAYPHTCGALTSASLPCPELPTMGTCLRDAGYITGAIGKVHVKGETREHDLGFDERAMRIYTYWFEDYIREVGEAAADTYATYRKPLDRFQSIYNPTNTPITLQEEEMYDALVVDRCIDFLERHQEQPFFLWAGLEKPHTDWTAPAEFHAMYHPADMQLPPTLTESRTDMPNAWYASTRQAWTFDEDEIRHCLAAYYANVTYLDHKVGQLLAALDRLGLRDDTLIVYTSDHGEMCFEHGMVQKQNFLEASVRVPFIISHPGEQILTTDTPANLIDLFPTFCDWAGVAEPEHLEGRSLLPRCQRDAPEAAEPASCSEYYEWGFPERMIRTPEWKYIYSHGEICQLYNLKDDPDETVNLIDDPAHAEARNQLHARLMEDWEMPEADAFNAGGPWNDITPEKARELMETWSRTRTRIHF